MVGLLVIRKQKFQPTLDEIFLNRRNIPKNENRLAEKKKQRRHHSGKKTSAPEPRSWAPAGHRPEEGRKKLTMNLMNKRHPTRKSENMKTPDDPTC